MSSQHTHGPWRLWREVYPLEEERPGLVILPEPADGGGGNKYAICGGGNAEANARLVASAPELMAALERIASVDVVEIEDAYNMRSIARKAIAKRKA